MLLLLLFHAITCLFESEPKIRAQRMSSHAMASLKQNWPHALKLAAVHTHLCAKASEHFDTLPNNSERSCKDTFSVHWCRMVKSHRQNMPKPDRFLTFFCILAARQPANPCTSIEISQARMAPRGKDLPGNKWFSHVHKNTPGTLHLLLQQPHHIRCQLLGGVAKFSSQLQHGKSVSDDRHQNRRPFCEKIAGGITIRRTTTQQLLQPRLGQSLFKRSKHIRFGSSCGV